MPSTAGSRSSRSASRRRRQPTAAVVANGKINDESAVLAEEVLAVEAILAGRPETSGRGSPWGMWTAVVVLEVVGFLWVRWAMDIYNIYSVARK